MQLLPVPPRDFDSYRWWEPVRAGPRWFYGSPRVRTRGTRHVQLDTVDPVLQDLVEAAHARGWRTLPSCAGHTVTLKGMLTAWRGVVSDLSSVWNEGLLLRDTETGRTVRWQDPYTQAPSFRSFAAHMDATDGRGVFGVTGMPPDARRSVGRAAVQLGFDVEPISKGVRLHLHLSSDEGRARAWRAMLPVLRDDT